MPRPSTAHHNQYGRWSPGWASAALLTHTLSSNLDPRVTPRPLGGPVVLTDSRRSFLFLFRPTLRRASHSLRNGQSVTFLLEGPCSLQRAVLGLERSPGIHPEELLC